MDFAKNQFFKICVFTSQKHEKKRFYPHYVLLKILFVFISACHLFTQSQGQPHGWHEHQPLSTQPGIDPPGFHQNTNRGSKPTEASAFPRASPVGDWTDARDPPGLATPSGPDNIGVLLQVGPTPATIGPRKPDNGESPTPDGIVL